MKKMLCLMLAVLMIVPMIVSCGKSDGNEVEYPNVKVFRYNDTTATATTEISSTPIMVAANEEGKVTLKEVVLSFDPAAYYEESTSRFVKISEFSADGEWFWNFQVNGAPANLATEVKPEDAIEIIYEPLNKQEAPAATAEAAA